MAKTEFHGEDRELDPDYFVPQSVRVEGSFQKAEISISAGGRTIDFTTREYRDTYSVETARNLIEALEDAIEYLENHPQRMIHDSRVRRTSKE